jgi:AhpD family alkylhydroperoxidase
MNARLDHYGSALGAKVLRHINSANEVIADSALPHTTQEPVRIRTSRINDCGFRADMHTKEEAYAGESRQRLNPAAWREATVFTAGPNAPRWNWPSRASGRRTRPAVSRTRSGRKPPGTTTSTGSPR